MDRKNICIWAIIIIVSPFILIPHVIVEWLPGDFFYGRKIAERYYSYGDQTIRFDEYRNYYVLSYLLDGKAVEKYSWFYPHMDGPFDVYVHFSDSVVEISQASGYEQIKGSDENRRIIINPEGSDEWVNMVDTFKYSNGNGLIELSEGNFRKCCNIQSNFYLDEESAFNERIHSEIKRVIILNRSY